MKEIKLITGNMWSAVGLIFASLIIASAAVFISLQHNKTQLDIANIQKDAQVESSRNVKAGLNEIGDGICKTSTKSTLLFC